jgi:maltose O-acetyltransferase
VSEKVSSGRVDGPGAEFLTPTHRAEAAPHQAKLEAARPIVVGDNVWLGGDPVAPQPGILVSSWTAPQARAVVLRF